MTSDLEFRAAALQRYFDRLFGQQSGWLVVATGCGPYVDEKGTYGHRGFPQSWWTWPDDADDVVHTVVSSAQSQRDIYVNPVLRPDGENLSRTKDYPILPAWHGWADCDGPWTDEREAAYQRLRACGIWHVDSGRGRHLYLPFSRPVDADELEVVNKTLVAAFGADAKWDRTSLLRPPGTLNWKPWAYSGGTEDPAEVRLCL